MVRSAMIYSISSLVGSSTTSGGALVGTSSLGRSGLIEVN